MNMSASLMNIVQLVRGGESPAAAKLVNVNSTSQATLIVADAQELLTADQFSDFKKYLRAEAAVSGYAPPRAVTARESLARG